jgi:hypothetical protein
MKVSYITFKQSDTAKAENYLTTSLVFKIVTGSEGISGK